jgi:RNA polymerase primary sigma factor
MLRHMKVESVYSVPSDVRGAESPMRLYFREIGEAPLLTPTEEVELANQLQRGLRAQEKLDQSRKRARGKRKAAPLSAQQRARTKDAVQVGKVARERLIKGNLRLVVKIAQDYANMGLPLLDLVSEGNIGLVKAVERFNPNKGAKLSTYAAWWIKQAVKRALSNQGRTIRIPVRMNDKISRMRRVEAQLHEEFGREPTDGELAEELRVPETKIVRMRIAGNRATSLNAKLQGDDGAELGDLVGDERSRTSSEIIERHELATKALKYLERLDERERLILVMRFGLDGRQRRTLEEVGEKFNVTRERIRQLQNAGLRSLQLALDSATEEQP